MRWAATIVFVLRLFVKASYMTIALGITLCKRLLHNVHVANIVYIICLHSSML